MLSNDSNHGNLTYYKLHCPTEKESFWKLKARRHIFCCLFYFGQFRHDPETGRRVAVCLNLIPLWLEYDASLLLDQHTVGSAIFLVSLSGLDFHICYSRSPKDICLDLQRATVECYSTPRHLDQDETSQ